MKDGQSIRDVEYEEIEDGYIEDGVRYYAPKDDVAGDAVRVMLIIIAVLAFIAYLGAADPAAGAESEPQPVAPAIQRTMSPVELMPLEEVPSIHPNQRVTEDHILELARVTISETRDTEQAHLIMQVVINRWLSEWRGKEHLWSIIHDRAQFSAYLDPDLRERYGRMGRDSKDAKFKEYLWMAEGYLTLKIPVEINPDCNHFLHDYVSPSWADGSPDIVVDTPNYPNLHIYCGVS